MGGKLLDRLVPFALLFSIGLLSETLPICLLLGLASTYFFRRFRNARPDGYLMHALYWTGLMPIKARCAINPYIRRVVP